MERAELSMRIGAALCLFLVSIVSALSGSYEKILITFNDKGREAEHIETHSITWEELPVVSGYVNQLELFGFRKCVTLKWQNKVSGYIESDQISLIKELSFVKSVSFLKRYHKNRGLPKKASTVAMVTDDLYTLTGISALHSLIEQQGNVPGNSIRIGIIDDSFLLGNKAFDHLYAENLIKEQWNFINGDSLTNINRSFGDSHGARVLSQIAGELEGRFKGIANQAEYLLYVTEDMTPEYYGEEDYLAAAIERAAENGARVISISLAYRYDFTSEPEHPYNYIDGKSSPASIAALGAARRNIVLCAAMGNEGGYHPAPNIAVPADADSILSVGALGADENVCSFSSQGPSFDGRVKPEIGAPGCPAPVINPVTTEGLENASGTSMSTPIIAGIATLLRQLYPDASAEDVRMSIMLSGSRAEQPDNIYGHGMVNAEEARRILDSFVKNKLPESEAAGLYEVYRSRSGFLAINIFQNISHVIRIQTLDGKTVFYKSGTGMRRYVVPQLRQQQLYLLLMSTVNGKQSRKIMF
ncbi:MAG: S8 family serine peptidase [Fibrobacteria bacterium]|nr:S8 family serine peptidase [Fibrobacteria bacterium]